MLDLGPTITATAERSPDAIAVVDGATRHACGDWAGIAARVAGDHEVEA